MDIGQMRIARLMILMLMCHCGCTQDFFSESLSLKILEDSLSCTGSCNGINVSFTLSNNSDDDILIYGLLKDGPGPAFNDLSGLCDISRTGTGTQFVLYRSDGRLERAEFEVRHGRRPVTREVLDDALNEMRSDFLKSKMVIKAHEKMTFVKEVPLKNFSLEVGLYYFEMVYYCGTKTAETLDLKEINQSGLKLFQGCARSQKISFVVY